MLVNFRAHRRVRRRGERARSEMRDVGSVFDGWLHPRRVIQGSGSSFRSTECEWPPVSVEDDAPSGRRPIYIEGEVSALARLLAVCPCAWLPSPVSVAVRLRALIMMKCQGMLRVGSRNAPRTLPHK